MFEIPKIIHYCWFGGKPLPKSAIKCINSWKKFFPDYEIREWNESNFDVNMIPYTREAYAAKKYAFVSDFARFWVLHEHGGVYFDTDVEVIRPMDDIIAKGAYLGMENYTSINPGLGMASPQGQPFTKWYINYFSDKHFVTEQASMIPVISKKLSEIGCTYADTMQELFFDGSPIYIYPPSVFNPKSFITGIINIDSDTRSIHHYDMSWFDTNRYINQKLIQLYSRFFNVQKSRRLAGRTQFVLFHLITNPYHIIRKILVK